MTLSEKVAYLKGLADGMKLDTEKEDGKLFKGIIDVLQEVADSVSKLEERCDDLNDYCEELDDDLAEAEDCLYGYDDEEYDEEDDEDYDEDDDFDLDDDDYDDEIIEIECPNCGETICVPPTIDFTHLTCPACNEEFSYIEEDAGPADEE